jgi:putative flippase GtrA
VKRISTSLVSYILVAVGSMASDWVVFISLSALGVRPLQAQMVGRLAGGVFSFVSNKYLSFDAKGSRRITIEARRFLGLYAVSYLLSTGIFYMLIQITDLRPVYAKVISDGLIFIFNFVIMRLYVFHYRHGVTMWMKTWIRKIRG